MSFGLLSTILSVCNILEATRQPIFSPENESRFLETVDLIFCVKFWELSHLTCDLSQAEQKTTVVKAEQLSNDNNFSFKMTTSTILSEMYVILCICLALTTFIFF